MELELEIQRRYLDSLDQPSWEVEDPRLDFGSKALPYFVAAFLQETIPSRRVRLIREIWGFRDPAAMPTLAIAMKDPSDEVWKEALDGIVALGGNAALATLNQARNDAVNIQNRDEKLSWIDEAVTQLTEMMREGD